MPFIIKKIINKIIFCYYSLLNFFHRADIFLITGHENWIIKIIAKEIAKNLNKIKPVKICLSVSPLFLKNKIIHFASLHSFTSHHFHVHPSNKIIISWYHINERDIEKIHAAEIREKNIIIHTSCSLTKNRLMDLGIRKEQIKIIPLGVDLKTFHPAKSPSEKEKIKKDLNLPENKIIIGSFQKDGNGWNEGLEPKLIKGPDIFCDTVEILAKQFPIHILLTGPARGYVKNRLKQANISFTHKYLKKYNDIVNFYHALDLYLIASRVEGGPMALLESWATGIPLITTPIGMIPDLGTNNNDLLISKSADPSELAALTEQIIQNSSLARSLSLNGLKKVRQFSWPALAHRYWQELYKPLL